MFKIDQDWRLLKRLNTSSKILIIALLALAFFVGVSIPLFLTRPQKATNNETTAVPTAIPKPITLSLTTQNEVVSLENTLYVQINIASEEREISAADFIVYFDPNFVKPTIIKEGDFFPNILTKKIEPEFIKIQAAATVKDNKFIFPKGKGTIATVSFKALKKTNRTLLYFDPDKTVVAVDGKSILTNITDLSLTIQ